MPEQLWGPGGLDTGMYMTLEACDRNWGQWPTGASSQHVKLCRPVTGVRVLRGPCLLMCMCVAARASCGAGWCLAYRVGCWGGFWAQAGGLGKEWGGTWALWTVNMKKPMGENLSGEAGRGSTVAVLAIGFVSCESY